MPKKIIVVGANHAGTSFLRTIRQLEKESEIVVYDRNDNISFLGCGIALWVGGEFKDPSGLFYATPKLLESLDIRVNMEHDVVKIDNKSKTVTVKDIKTGTEFEDKYDVLVYAGGSWPIVPPLEGVQLKGIHLSKIYQHAQQIYAEANNPRVKKVVVVGGGYIGIELVEAFHLHKKQVTLIDMETRVIPRYFDPEFTHPLEARMKKDGITIRLGEKVERFLGDKNGNVTAVVTDKGEYAADLVILSIGFRPNTSLLPNLDKIPGGSIVVNKFCQSSDKNVYIIGDSAALPHNVLEKPANVSLATNAVKTGVVAALHVAGGDKKAIPFPGMQGTNAIGVFGFKYASTGLSEESCKTFKLPYKTVFFEDNDRPEFMKTVSKVQIKITYDPSTLRILGAQIGSQHHDHTESILLFSSLISSKKTMLDLALTDFFFLPHFNKPFNFMLVGALTAAGLKY